MQKITRGLCDDILRGLSEKQDEFKSSKLIDLIPMAESMGLDRETLSCALAVLEDDELILNGSCETSVCALIRRKGWLYLKELESSRANNPDGGHCNMETADSNSSGDARQQIELCLDLGRAQLA